MDSPLFSKVGIGNNYTFTVGARELEMSGPQPTNEQPSYFSYGYNTQYGCLGLSHASYSFKIKVLFLSL
jgi:hypothetical protein